eukprot:765229-Hanusia_phi.AAC.3
MQKDYFSDLGGQINLSPSKEVTCPWKLSPRSSWSPHGTHKESISAEGGYSDRTARGEKGGYL